MEKKEKEERGWIYIQMMLVIMPEWEIKSDF